MYFFLLFFVFYVKCFFKNKFVFECNLMIVMFDVRNLDVGLYVEFDFSYCQLGELIWYDLVVNVVYEVVRQKEDVVDSVVGEEKKMWKVQLRDKSWEGEWVVVQDLFVEKIREELFYLGEMYLQVWERRDRFKVQGGSNGKGKGRMV